MSKKLYVVEPMNVSVDHPIRDGLQMCHVWVARGGRWAEEYARQVDGFVAGARRPSKAKLAMWGLR